MSTIRAEFSPIDEIMDLADTARYPVNVHIEVKAPGPLDAAKMRAAVLAALEKHPLARARKLPPEPRDKQLYWEITEVAGIDPFLVVEGGDTAGVNRARKQLLSAQLPLHESPPLRVWLVRCESGDHLILNVSHAVADGIGTLRFLRSIVRAYNGERDDTGTIDPLQARDVDALYSPASQAEKARRLKSFGASLKAQMPEPTGITAAGLGDYIAYGCHHLSLEADEVAALNAKRHVKATINDLLVAAMHHSIDVWNGRLGDDSALIRVSSPVNLRPSDWWFEVFGNFAMSFATHTQDMQREDPATLMQTVVQQSRDAKEQGYAEAMLLGLSLGSKLPVWMKNLMTQSPGGSRAASAMLTNAGRIAEAISFVDLGDALEVWMSPPAVMPDGLGLGVTHYNGRMHLAFRFSYELFDDDAAAAFAETFHESLVWLS